MLTFRSFTSGDQLFDMLLARFMITAPAGMDESQKADWVRLKAAPIQLRWVCLRVSRRLLIIRVVNVYRAWLDVHFMADQDEPILEKIDAFANQPTIPGVEIEMWRMLAKTLQTIITRRVSAFERTIADCAAQGGPKQRPPNRLWRPSLPACALSATRLWQTAPTHRHQPPRARAPTHHHRICEFPESPAGRVPAQSVDGRRREQGEERPRGHSDREQIGRLDRVVGSAAQRAKEPRDIDEVLHPVCYCESLSQDCGSGAD
jgi:hypothetical protein